MIVNHETALKTLRRMTHEILEKNDDVASIETQQTRYSCTKPDGNRAARGQLG